MTAEDVRKLLNLVPHPREGGCYVRTYESGELIAPDAFADLRYPSARHTCTAIYYLLEPGTFSEMHRLASDEIFHFYAGDPVEMLQLAPDSTATLVRIGNDLAAGQRPQIIVRRDVWQGSRLVPGGRWALLGCTVSPGFEFEDYEPGDRAQLSAAWPEEAAIIAALTRNPHA